MTLNSAPFYSPYKRPRHQRISESYSIPSKAERISVGTSIRGGNYSVTPTNWNEWDCPPGVQTPAQPETSSVADEDEDDDQNQNQKGFFSPDLKKFARRFLGRNRQDKEIQQDDSHPPVMLSDDYEVDDDDDDDDEERGYPESSSVQEYDVPEEYTNNNNNNNNKNSRRLPKKRRIKASTPLWLSEESDTAMGYVHIGPAGAESTTAASRVSSLGSFTNSPRLLMRRGSIGRRAQKSGAPTVDTSK